MTGSNEPVSFFSFKLGVVVAVLFFLQGLAWLAIFPPVEGWDEYQHLGYIVYLDEKGSPPEAGKSLMPTSLIPFLRSVPLPTPALTQGNISGRKSYKEFWDGATGAVLDANDTGEVILYQAQHPALYYRLMLPIWRVFKTDPISGIYVLRIINLFFGGLTVFVLSRLLARIGTGPVTGVFLLLPMLAFPLAILNCARIANDSLAILLGVIAVAFLVTVQRETFVRSFGLASLAASASLATKETGLVLAPALVATFAFYWFRWRLPVRTVAMAGVLAIAVAICIAGPKLYSNWRTHHSISSAQETTHVREKGEVGPQLKAAFQELAWRQMWAEGIHPGPLLVAGWSFHLPPYKWIKLHRKWMFFGACAIGFGAGWVIWRMIRKTRPFILPTRRAFTCAVAPFTFAIVVLSSLAALAWFSVLSKAAWGNPTTNSWYFQLAWPFWMLLIGQGVLLLGRIALVVFSTGLFLIYTVTGWMALHSWLPEFYANSNNPAVIHQRLSSIHPGWIGPSQLGLFEAAIVLCLCAMCWLVFKSWRSKEKTGASKSDYAVPGSD